MILINDDMDIKTSEKSANVPKKIPSLKSGFCGSIVSDSFWNFQNWSTGRLRKCVSFLPPSIGRKVVVTVFMVQTVSLLLPVD